MLFGRCRPGARGSRISRAAPAPGCCPGGACSGRSCGAGPCAGRAAASAGTSGFGAPGRGRRTRDDFIFQFSVPFLVGLALAFYYGSVIGILVGPISFGFGVFPLCVWI